MASTLLWVVAALAAAGLLVAAVAWVEAPAAPPAAEPAHGMPADAMCRHMPEHCANATGGAP
jgi:hypothetical protein